MAFKAYRTWAQVRGLLAAWELPLGTKPTKARPQSVYIPAAHVQRLCEIGLVTVEWSQHVSAADGRTRLYLVQAD